MSNQYPSMNPALARPGARVARYDTKLAYYGRKVIEVGVPVVTYLDDPAWDGHNPMALPPDVRPDAPQRTYSPYRMKGNIGPQAMRAKISKLVIHHDACLNARSCFRVLVRRGLSTHFIIDNDGIIYQPWDLCHSTWHVGAVNSQAIGFDMSNAATLQYASYYRDRGVFTGEINGSTFTSLGYSEAQYLSCIAAIRELTRYFPRIKPVPPIGPDGKVIMGMIADEGFEGVLGHFHLSAHKWDPGPGFDWKRVFNSVHGGGFAFPLSLSRGGGGNDLMGGGADATARRFYVNNESYTGGGWYPIGLNGVWHSGVHLHGEQGQRVNNIFDGEIVAARFTTTTDLGSPNFVLLRHILRQGKEEKAFFSLYMHLAPVRFGGALLPWMLEAREKAGPRPRDAGSVDWDALDTGDGEPDPATLRPRKGKNYWALTQGKTAVFDPPIPLRGNMLVGYMGSYGPEDEASAQMDFSIFTAEQIIDLKKFHRDWVALNEDVDENSVCDIDEVVRKVDRRFTRFGGRAVVSSDEISRFYNENPNRAEVRAYISRHVSEWWANTDWKEALQRRNVWAWDTERKLAVLQRKLAPFQWYDEEIAKDVGLPEDGIIYTYHPIRFILWLAKTQGGSNIVVDRHQRGLTASELAQARKIPISDKEDPLGMLLNAEGKDPENVDFGWGEDLPDLEEWKRNQGPGEWAPETDDLLDIWD